MSLTAIAGWAITSVVTIALLVGVVMGVVTAIAAGRLGEELEDWEGERDVEGERARRLGR